MALKKATSTLLIPWTQPNPIKRILGQNWML
jgi:hypothetical protein